MKTRARGGGARWEERRSEGGVTRRQKKAGQERKARDWAWDGICGCREGDERMTKGGWAVPEKTGGRARSTACMRKLTTSVQGEREKRRKKREVEVRARAGVGSLSGGRPCHVRGKSNKRVLCKRAAQAGGERCLPMYSQRRGQ